MRLEYDRFNNELNSKKAELNSITRTYQQFCDRNIELKNREDELRKSISKLEAGAAELQKARLNGSLSQSAFQDNDRDNTNMILKARLEEIILTSNVSTLRSNITNNHQNEIK